MYLDNFQLFLLVGGSCFTVLGGLVVFSDSFLSAMERGPWKDSRIDKALFSKKSGYLFNRYGRGLGALSLGIGMLLLFLHSLWK
jgi:hypothetical protein